MILFKSDKEKTDKSSAVLAVLFTLLAVTIVLLLGQAMALSNTLAEQSHYKELGKENLSQIKAQINTPQDVIKFRDANFHYITDIAQYGKEEYVASMQTFYNHSWNGDCEDFAITIAGLLADNGYAPTTLSLVRNASSQEKAEYGMSNSSGFLGHRIYVYQENGKWGAIGVSSSEDRAPVYENMTSLVASLNTGENSQYPYQLAQVNPLKNLSAEYPSSLWINGIGDLSSRDALR